jgi:glutathione S-transferase
MMKLFYTPASPFVRKCSVTIRELGLEDRVEIIPTKWPHSWGTETVPYREDFLAATPIARIPALVTEDGERLTESSLICEYLNDELGGYRLCPQSGRERWHILSVVSVATSGIMESLVARRAELLRKRDASQNKQEFSPSFVRKMMERIDRCYQRLDELSHDFRADVDLGQIAAGCACGNTDFRYPEDVGAPSPPTLRAGTSGSAGDHQCAQQSPARPRSTATTRMRPPATRRDQGATGGSGAVPLSDIPGSQLKSLALDALQPAGPDGSAECREILQQRRLPCCHQCD